ncbi:hypothetical protein Ancab_022842 [Ancistrocladus abbreviatus]
MSLNSIFTSSCIESSVFQQLELIYQIAIVWELGYAVLSTSQRTMESDRTVAALPPPPPPPPSLSDGSRNSLQRARSTHGRTSGPTRRSTRGQWTPEEDEILHRAVQRFKGKNWKKIAECFKDRTDVQCLHRWQKVLNPELIKGPWTKEEDETIIQLVDKFGPKKWSTIAQHLPGRIGKQCRERWHNHLNPSINKEAWTQEEEVILIHAHQLYGNKWAELTKFLPGRTDNAIKNHWNSSVKKKLDSYIASGLLARFQGLPVVNQNQSTPSCSSGMQQSSGDDNAKDGAEGEENSECSQGSLLVGCLQTANNMPNAVCYTKEEFLSVAESGQQKELSASPASCSEQYCPSLEDITISFPEIHAELSCNFTCSTNCLEENFPQDAETRTRECHLDAHELAIISSLQSVTESSGLAENCICDVNQEIVAGAIQTSTGNISSALGDNMAMSSETHGYKLETQAVRFTDVGVDGGPSIGIHRACCDLTNWCGYEDAYLQSSSFQVSESVRIVAPQSQNSLSTEMVGTSRCQTFASIPSGNGSIIYSGPQGQEYITSGQDGFIYLDTPTSPCDDHIDVSDLTEQLDQVKDLSKLVPVNTFGSGPSDRQPTQPSLSESQVMPTDEQESGALCYEPPRFPSLDIPFFSCDLAQPGMDAQQEYSPLGIRQLMMSSAISLTPFRLWDSPSSDDSPDAMLKTAAKTFTYTPSILKKRHRDLLSPLSPFSERQFDKKLGNDSQVLCTSSLTKEFSRLDVMFNDADAPKEHMPSTENNQNSEAEASMEDKENVCPELPGREEIVEKTGTPVSDDKTPLEVTSDNTLYTNAEETVDIETKKMVMRDAADEAQPRGVLVEQNENNVHSSSPNGVKLTEDRASDSIASKAHYMLEVASKQGPTVESLLGNHISVVSPHGVKKHDAESPVSSVQSVSSMTSVMVESLANEISIENLNILGETPFRRSIESPSAWKSPWFFNPLVPGPRFDADLTIEDIGIFMSPGESSYDAIGLMKQINEQSADAYADAREVLGNETPESILKQRCFKSQYLKQENNCVLENQWEGPLHLASTVLMEQRTLDFSECGMPGKTNDKEESPMSSSSPSSLLRSYR